MATSSAEPEKLFHYSDVTLSLDSEVKSESARLRGDLAHFESGCREPGFRLSVVHHAGSMNSYGSQCETTDSWVHRVGSGFLAADSGGLWGGAEKSWFGLPRSENVPGTAVPWLPWIIGIIITPPWLLPIVLVLPWIKKSEPTPPAPDTQPSPQPTTPSIDTTPPPATSNPETSIQEGTQTGTYNADASTDDCVGFVKGQPNRNVPSGFSTEHFYSGDYRGKSGTLSDGTSYGQVPGAGAIMVESPNGAGITYGHASYVYEVTRDASGKVIGYKIVEGNWDTRPKAEQVGSPPVHYETFSWDETQQKFVSPSGKRSPDMFIY